MDIVSVPFRLSDTKGAKKNLHMATLDFDNGGTIQIKKFWGKWE